MSEEHKRYGPVRNIRFTKEQDQRILREVKRTGAPFVEVVRRRMDKGFGKDVVSETAGFHVQDSQSVSSAGDAVHRDCEHAT